MKENFRRNEDNASRGQKKEPVNSRDETIFKPEVARKMAERVLENRAYIKDISVELFNKIADETLSDRECLAIANEDFYWNGTDEEELATEDFLSKLEILRALHIVIDALNLEGKTSFPKNSPIVDTYHFQKRVVQRFTLKQVEGFTGSLKNVRKQMVALKKQNQALDIYKMNFMCSKGYRFSVTQVAYDGMELVMVLIPKKEIKRKPQQPKKASFYKKEKKKLEALRKQKEGH